MSEEKKEKNEKSKREKSHGSENGKIKSVSERKKQSESESSENKSRKVIAKYDLTADELKAEVRIIRDENEYVPVYEMSFPHIQKATHAVLDHVRHKIVEDMTLNTTEIIDPKETKELKKRFMEKAENLIKEFIPHLKETERESLIGLLTQESLGLGELEVLLQDLNLEEIVVNSSKEPVWVYDRKYGWLKTNIIIDSESRIYNYSAQIGRRVGMQISNLNPLMDAYLTTGDRANCTLFPISSAGNTMTIRKFARRAWTITDFIEDGTLSFEVAAFLWLAIQYELNIVVAGGTASGKTSLLNVLSLFIPPTQRIISIEDTREIQLPKFLHWLPLTTRPSNLEGRGEVSMLDLMVNALRMRPDRIVVGEIRRTREAEVLFEAINTGHSVYSTLHANTADEAYRRLVNPPINIAPALLGSLQLIVVQHRDRRKGIRRLLEVSELIPASGLDQIRIELNTIFKWVPAKDHITQWGKPHRALNDIKLYSAMSDDELQKNLAEKRSILKWLVDNNVKDIQKVGKMISDYYKHPDKVLKTVGFDPDKVEIKTSRSF